MKFAPKVLLGIAALLAFVLIYQIKNPQESTQFKIEAYEDHFKVGASVQKKDEEEARKALERLNLPQHFLKGFEFELGSTSSAKLAFASPILVDLNLQNDQINFAGLMVSSQKVNLKINPNLKIPKNTKVGIFANDFIKFAQKSLTDSQLIDWYNQNFATPGQYLIIFDNEFVIIAPKVEAVSFDQLKKTQDTNDEQIYKQENYQLQSGSTVELHIAKLATFFQLTDNLYFASSPKAAKDFLNAQTGNAPSTTFWEKKPQEVSAAVFWQRQETSGGKDLELILETDHNVAKYLENLERVTFIQKNDKFEGAIKFKSSN